MNNAVTVDIRQGRVRIENLTCGVSAASYSGLVDKATFDALRATALEKAKNRDALIIDTSRVVTTVNMSEDFFPDPDALTRLPGVVVCREDQLEPWQRYSAKLAEYGVIRVVFLHSERERALDLAEFFARSSRPQELSLQPGQKQLRA